MFWRVVVGEVRYQEIRESGRLKRREVMEVRGGPSGGGRKEGGEMESK